MVYGECGGYMVLGQGLIDSTGARHQMAGLLPLESSFARPKLSLGYREAVVVGDGPLGRAGATYRGHEFHYAQATVPDDGPALFQLRDSADSALGAAGLAIGRVGGSFIHLVDQADAAP